MARELTLAVVGIDYPNADRSRTNRRSELLLLDEGADIELRPEPKNPHDPHAVAVFSSSGIQVGYLTAERAPWIGAKIRDGEEISAIFQGLESAAAFIRIRIGGGRPSLPGQSAVEAASSQPAEDGFWPDETAPNGVLD
ncbi:HIRAN domain-containing protein [Sphingomonas sp. BK235]|uniref:HIRAN domain-containing protein n=1 Tax=Sphingomonas sp. BK235 TaxID=2512131 RepID=UPI00104DECCE|nr:HIRAN domain-containing protein [Sphingomonas sp. BK235]